MTQPPKDFLRQEIRVGDRIVYPGRASSSLWMNKATVVEIVHVVKFSSEWYRLVVDVEQTYYNGEPTGKTRRVTLDRLDRVTVVPL